jgi:hypothetical protein
MIPAAALGLKKNLGGASATSTSGKDEDAAPTLGHSEVSAIQHSPGEVVKPEFGQRREYDGEISTTVGGKKSGYVLNKEPATGAENSCGDSGEVEEEGGSLAGEAGAAAGVGEILAGESSGEEVNTKGAWVIPPSWLLNAGATSICRISRRWLLTNKEGSKVGVAGDSGPVSGEDGPALLVGLALPEDSHPGPLEAEVETSDSGAS